MGDLPRVVLAVAASEAEFKGLARDKWHSCRAMRHPAMPSWKRLGARHGRWSGTKKDEKFQGNQLIWDGVDVHRAVNDWTRIYLMGKG